MLEEAAKAAGLDHPIIDPDALAEICKLWAPDMISIDVKGPFPAQTEEDRGLESDLYHSGE